MSYLYYLCLLVYSGTFVLYPTRLDYATSSMSGVLSIRDISWLLFASACTVHFVFVWGPCVLTFVLFVSLRIVACVLKDASVSGLSILVYSFRFH
jgi:hypothetical protein